MYVFVNFYTEDFLWQTFYIPVLRVFGFIDAAYRKKEQMPDFFLYKSMPYGKVLFLYVYHIYVIH